MVKYFTDQMNRKVGLKHPPQRIVSLVPSQTELLYDLGLKDEVVGQTLFCIHPEWAHLSKPRVGGTKKLKIDKIKELRPDLIIGNKEENERSQIEALEKDFPVWMSDITDLKDALDMISRVGELVNKSKEAGQIVKNIAHSYEGLTTLLSKKRTAYFIWCDPWMVAGKGTFINDMLSRCGWMNVFANEASRYPEITNERLAKEQPELLLLSSEPYPFKEKHIGELQQICPEAKIILVDGEMFSWYGSRLLKAPDYFKGLRAEI